MTFEIWLAFIAATLLLMSTPGPSQLLILSNSLSNGFRRSLATMAGDLTANSIQISIVAFGLASLLTSSPRSLATVKWFGVAWLVSLGVRKINAARRTDASATPASPAPAGDASATPASDASVADASAPPTSGRKSLRKLGLEGFVNSSVNPKAIIFFAAFLPQFVVPTSPLGIQFFLLGLTYIVLDGSILSLYAIGAGKISARLSGVGRQRGEIIAGALLVVAAVLLGLRGVPS